MKPRVYVGIAALSLTAAVVFASWTSKDGVAGGGGQAAGLEVHEWGTFTSMQGQNGLSLEGLHHEEEALPAFVHRVVETPVTSETFGKGGVNAVRVTEKMETPVIYFYPDRAMNVKVQVDYSGGVMSEWFPAADHRLSSSRGVAATGPEVLDVSRVRHSSLHWDVELKPFSEAPPAGVPAVKADDPWSFARETKAAYVTHKATGESEHYLFYRGLGKRSLPVTVEQRKGGNLRIKNETGAAIPAAFVLESNPGGARWMAVGGITKTREASIGEVAHRPNRIVAAELKEAVEDALVDTGLFRDEAIAMVKTWSRSWFESEGSRVIYIVPRKTVDGMLPLRISPTPTKLVRTLVGRLEYIRPEVAREIATAVRHRFARGKRATAATARLARLGRYLEPHLRLLLSTTSDPLTKRNATKLLEAL